MKHLSFALVVGSVLLSGSNALAQETAKVTITITISEKTPSFSDQRLVVMLYHDNPLEGDRGDTAVDRHIDAKFSHVVGKKTVATLTLGEKAKRKFDVEYSVSVTVFDKASKRTHLGEIDGNPGPFPVLTGGTPNKLAVVVNPAR